MLARFCLTLILTLYLTITETYEFSRLSLVCYPCWLIPCSETSYDDLRRIQYLKKQRQPCSSCQKAFDGRADTRICVFKSAWLEWFCLFVWVSSRRRALDTVFDDWYRQRSDTAVCWSRSYQARRSRCRCRRWSICLYVSLWPIITCQQWTIFPRCQVLAAV